MEQHPEDIIAQLQSNYPTSSLQATAWEATIHHLRASFEKVTVERPNTNDWRVLFEYELPREGGRRPDLCILTESDVFVIEVKNQGEWNPPHVEQLRGYIRDLQNYHLESREESVHGALLILGRLDLDETVQEIKVLSPKNLAEALLNIQGERLSAEEAKRWMNSEYHPLPQLVQAAKQIWDRDPLPQIRSAKSANIPQTLKKIRDTIHTARSESNNHLILLTGPAGSGKTLVGLQAVYDLVDEHHTKKGTYLSGNGPLIQVLQHVLKSKGFVQDVHRFIREYGIKKRSVITEDFLVFDEAQRAWNADKIHDFYLKKNVADPPKKSEPELFIEAADAVGAGVTVLALIGTGQEIHSGEQNGVSLWRTAVSHSEKDWQIVGPKTLETYFQNKKFLESKELDLGTSLRSHAAEELHAWAEAFVRGDLEAANALASKLQRDYFSIYVTQDIDQARWFARSRYEGEPQKTYGLITSSKARNLKDIGIDITMFGKDQVRLNRDEAAWYAGKNGNPPECLLLEKAATEFTCQGLELDTTVVLWGYDYVWTGSQWESRKGRPNPLIKDPHELRVNTYRVLLTRARDGIVIVVPEDKRLKKTYEALISSGAMPINLYDPQEISSRNGTVAPE